MPGPYSLNNGAVWFTTSSGTEAMINDATCRLGVAFDAKDGILHKHGLASQVTSWADQSRAAFIAKGFPEIAASLTTITFPATERAIAELNACIGTSGRVLQFPQNLCAAADLLG